MIRKRSRQVSTGLVALVAAQFVMQGCGPSVTEVRRCVDYYGRLLPDGYCTYPYGTYPSGYGGLYYTGNPVFVYGGSGGYSYGNRIVGYSTSPSYGARVIDPQGRVLSRSSYGGSGGSFSGGTARSTSRGGFGHSSFGHFGGFGG